MNIVQDYPELQSNSDDHVLWVTVQRGITNRKLLDTITRCHKKLDRCVHCCRHGIQTAVAFL